MAFTFITQTSLFIRVSDQQVDLVEYELMICRAGELADQRLQWRMVEDSASKADD
jgi:hypothetical protein